MRTPLESTDALAHARSAREAAKMVLSFTMPFEAMTIKHLGLKLYSTFPPVIAELVSNAFDAEAPKAEVVLPSGPINALSEVVVRDFGHGMDAGELQENFLPIGRNRRGSFSKEVMSKNGKVRVTGRKGLGKLSAFGVAGEMDVRSVVAKNAICIRLNYEDMLTWCEKNPGKPYRPSVVAERTGPTDEQDGTEIRLRKLYRTKAISDDDVRRGLASRLAFIGRKFQVKVNGREIKPDDRGTKEDCDAGFCWDVNDITGIGGMVDSGLTVTGWIGFLPKSSATMRGVDIFANNKAVELGSFFNYSSTHAQFARAHLYGQINADFLDSEHDDNISTARNSVVWESEQGQLLENWGKRVLSWAFGQWLALRKNKAEEKIVKTGGFDKWMDSRSAREQRTALRLVKVLAKNEGLETDAASVEPLLDIVKSSVEAIAFQELLDALESNEEAVPRLLELFSEWRVIEAREHLKLADGRMSVLEKFDKFIKVGALEVQEMQPLFTENLWLLDPAWTEADVQPTYTKMLREKCLEPKDYEDTDRRLDIFGVTTSAIATIVELKRPEKTLSRKDLEQIEKYVDWARSQFSGSGPDAPKHISGLLLVGKMNSTAEVQKKVERLAGDDIRVETFGDLYNRSRRYYADVEKTLKSVAPEYVRRRKAKAPG